MSRAAVVEPRTIGTSAATALQGGSVRSRLFDAATEVAGLIVVAGVIALLVAMLYRWYVRDRVPAGLPILFGLSAVALYLGSSRTLRELINPGTGTGDPLDEVTALANILTFALALVAARAGTDIGDRIGADLVESTGSEAIESTVNPVVQAVGRVITVELPEEIDDIVGYDPVPDRTKQKLAGKTFVFPKRLTVAELRDRLVTRLKADYAVGHVDVELSEDGTVSYLALGSRASGIGPTIPPETAAVAINADPAFAASAGDLVQVWRTDPAERVLTGEVRGTADDVVTLAIDAADARKLDDTTEYKLVTLPVESRPDREFASVLRAADETMAAVGVAAGSDLDGRAIGATEIAIVAVRPSGGPVEPLPEPDRAIEGGDTLYLVATPEAIRRVESAAAPPAVDEPDDGASPGAEMPPDRRIDATTPIASESETPDAGSRSSRDGSTGSEDSTASEHRDEAGEDPAGGAVASDGDADEDETGHAGEEPVADETPVSEDGPIDDESNSGDGRTVEENANGAEADAESADGEEAIVGSADGEEADAESEPISGFDDLVRAGEGRETDERAPGSEEPADPTTEDLADLPGTDPGDLTGTDRGDESDLPETSEAEEARESAPTESDDPDPLGEESASGQTGDAADPLAFEGDDSMFEDDDSIDDLLDEEWPDTDSGTEPGSEPEAGDEPVTDEEPLTDGESGAESEPGGDDEPEIDDEPGIDDGPDGESGDGAGDTGR